MTKRLLFPAFLAVAAIASLSACNTDDDPTNTRKPINDEWEEVASLPAAQFKLLSVGDRIASENFANRGNIEVTYKEGTDKITIEMQRFTVAEDAAAAQVAFDKMQYWGYAISAPEPPSEENMIESCANPDADAVDSCYVRAYYDGLFQPVRDGANFRVTIPTGWDGDLLLVTSDNLEEGIDSYPDRGNISVDGVAGNLDIDLDSGNVTVKMDPNTQHYAGCGNNDTCVEMGYAMGCGCSEPTNINIANKKGQASNITVDVGNADNWYTMILENRGIFSSSDDFVCNATIECGDFGNNCIIDPAYEGLPNQERADVNYPGVPAIEGAGMRIALVSESCANIRYVNGPEDFEADPLPEQKQGELLVCVGCL
ncbi:hypothetical protein DB30_02272 [Enhygromyxa salina]|uniref:Adhesin domain-containing protein n=1 Tax=Enhygromyxa salina TaxID=215803 RepID=A0A0C2CVM4_9BACT|nr:hypothetical protein [Enhygromyxa salina]KIG11937.1 hypothetical protein DB30_02272 [Enhygromyxa salina]